MNKTYSEYFKVSELFDDCMDKERINTSPDKWLAFYPHETFVKLLQTLLGNLAGGNKSIWLSGPYGTGKSHAALVLQKLFMDDAERVERWLQKRKLQIPEAVANGIRAQRAAKVFVVFDSGSDNIASPNAFLARIEGTVIKALKEFGGKVPPSGQMDKILERVCQEGHYFFEARDRIQNQLEHLTCDITTAEELSKRTKNPKLQAGLLHDIMLVLQERSVYLGLTSDEVLKWLDDIREANGFSKILFIWDEFSEYINNNSNQLGTFQNMAQASQSGHFFFIPVTHIQLQAFKGSGADNATKVSNRFDSIVLDMPTNTALNLAADALETINDDWEKDRAVLWQSIKPLITGYMAGKDTGCKQYPDSFLGILPLHPMTAFLLKFLSTSIGANQRSMFSFLRSKTGDSEFQQFIKIGGPSIPGRQFLTVDYLWHYFIERDDLGTAKEVYEVRIEYANKSVSLSDNEKRVFKAVLLYSLLGRMTTLAGHELIQPTIDNIRRCFEGDGNVQDVASMLKEMERKHCFSIINNRCEMFHTVGSSVDLDKQKEKLQGQFKQQVLDLKTCDKLDSRVKQFKDKLHYEVRAATPETAAASCQAKKDLFGETGNKVLLQFIIAKDAEEQQKSYDVAIELAKRWREWRMLFIVLPELHFCSWNASNWEEYVDQLAHKELATDVQTKTNYETQLKLMEDEWHRKLIRPDQKLQLVRPNPIENGEPYTEERNWNTLEAYLKERLKEWFKYYLDEFSSYNTTAMQQSGTGYKAWAMAGIDFTSAGGAQKNVVKSFEKEGISNDRAWFESNPEHPLAQLRDFCRNKLNNALNGSLGTCSIRKIFIDLQRPPFGLLGVGYSAFVMGAVMKDWLDGGRQQLQWTDGVQSLPLDATTLAEMIEVVVKNEGVTSIRNEKLLCRLSKEEKKFIECAPKMFGIGHVANATIENTLQNIASRLEKISNKAPLWVLPEHIKRQGDVQAELISDMIHSLCEAEKISSKGDLQKRMEHIKAIGKCLMETEGLDEYFAKYISTPVFDMAFQEMVSARKPELKKLAESIGDSQAIYCEILKDHFAETSSWLWNQVDVDNELDILEAKYKIISAIQYVAGIKSYMSYEDAMAKLKSAMETNNHISLETLGNEYPVINHCQRLIDAQKAGDGYLKLADFLEHQKDILKELFFDPANTLQLKLLRKIFARQLENISEQSIIELYNHLSVGSLRSDEDFKKTALIEIEAYQKASLARKLEAIWQEKTGTSSSHEWCAKHRMPVETLFEQASLAREIIPVLTQPGAYQPSVLEATIVKLDAARMTPLARLSTRFLELVLPAKFSGLGIDVEKLLTFMEKHLGANAEEWLFDNAKLHNTIDRFMCEFYSVSLKHEVVAKATKLSEAEAKKALLKLLESTPEAGLDFLNL